MPSLGHRVPNRREERRTRHLESLFLDAIAHLRLFLPSHCPAARVSPQEAVMTRGHTWGLPDEHCLDTCPIAFGALPGAVWRGKNPARYGTAGALCPDLKAGLSSLDLRAAALTARLAHSRNSRFGLFTTLLPPAEAPYVSACPSVKLAPHVRDESVGKLLSVRARPRSRGVVFLLFREIRVRQFTTSKYVPPILVLTPDLCRNAFSLRSAWPALSQASQSAFVRHRS